MGYQKARKKQNQDIQELPKNYQYVTCLRLSIRSMRMLGKVVYFLTWLSNHKILRQDMTQVTHLLMAPI